jgi:hypothetical protein
VRSPGDLSPLPFNRTTFQTPLHVASSLRGRIDDLAGSANKVIFGVVDSSFGVFRSLLPGSSDSNALSTLPMRGGGDDSNVAKPGSSLLRRDASSGGFSIASIAASLPVPGVRSKTSNEETGQQLVVVSSRPPSVKSGYTGNEGYTDDEYGTDDVGGDGEGKEEVDEMDGPPDSRSIQSFESMMKKRARRASSARKSLSDRLANMPGLSKPQDAFKVSLLSELMAGCSVYLHHV